MSTYLISGAAGYVGTSLSRQIVERGGSVRRLARADLTRREAIERALEGVEAIFHLAAQTSVYVAAADPVADLAANVLPMLHLLEACRARASRVTIVFASTATVHGVVGDDAPDEPITIYDLHKLAAERYLRQYVEIGAVRGGTLRLANVYGPGPPGAPDRGVLNAMVRRALAGQPLQIYGTGDHLRDYVYVDDVARAFLLAATHADELGGRSFVVGTGVGHTTADAFRKVARLAGARTGRDVEVVHVAPPATQSPIELRDFVARTAPLEQAIGFVSAVALDDGLARTIDSYAAPS